MGGGTAAAAAGGRVSAAELARHLGVSRPRVTQYVQGGRLDGTFVMVAGRRMFDAVAVARRLDRVLDPGQMLGTGAPTKARRREIVSAAGGAAAAGEGDGQAWPPASSVPAAVSSLAAAGIRRLPEPPVRQDGELAAGDQAIYEMARAQQAVEAARRARRLNAEAEGTLVLAGAVEAEMARALARELVEVETMLRDAARAVADTLGADFKQVRSLLLDVWRAHRARRSAVLAGEAEVAALSVAEGDADF